MKILYVDYQMYGKEDIIQTFLNMGYDVEISDLPLAIKDERKLQDELGMCIKLSSCDAVFTSNYYPMISNLCMQYHVKYISWTYDSPLISLYDSSIRNSCNYAFIFDKSEVNKLKNFGVHTVYHLPLAVNIGRVDKIGIEEKDKRIFSCDVSMVASLYNEQHNLYERMLPKLSDYTRGYLEAVMTAQTNIFGGYILEDCIRDEKILSEMQKAVRYKLVDGSLASLEYVYGNYFLGRKTASMQRLQYIKEISAEFDMKVYTPGDLSDIKTVKHMGTVDYMTDMNKVFRLSKINLNITLPTIRTGIPLRALDIMAAGGFLLSNYQDELFDWFEPGVHFDYFTSIEDAKNKIHYYLENDMERQKIAKNARQRIAEVCSYESKLKEVMDVLTKRGNDEENTDK